MQWKLAAAATLLVLAGCLESGSPADGDGSPPSPTRAVLVPPPATSPPPAEEEPEAPPAPRTETAWDAVLSVTVPLDVVLLGFPPATAAAVAEAFAEPYGPDQGLYHAYQRYRLDEPGLPAGGYGVTDAPFRQQARVRVYDAGPDAAAYRQAVAGASAWDGDAAEAWAAEQLLAWGIAPGPLPPLVVAHAGTKGHSYRVAYPNGGWDEARVMGGGARVLLMDLSAAPDPFAGDAEPFQSAIGADDADAVVAAIREAIRFRLLHGPIYPISLAPCHAVTLLYAVETAAGAGLVSTVEADAALDEAALEAAFEELTREEVHVDVVRLDLPQDDAVLGALARGTSAGGKGFVAGVDGGAVAAAEAQDAIRAWIEDNWDAYHVAHEGCEPYLSLLVFGDAADTGYYGFAEYDEGVGHRYSFSLLGENVRSLYEPGPAGGVFCCRPEDITGFDLVDMLFSHETGHLFGLAHPHNALDGEEPALDWSFSTTRTVMSYLVDERDIGFGLLDQASWDRNRALLAADALDAADLREEAVAAGFLERIQEGDWRAAVVTAQILLADT